MVKNSKNIFCIFNKKTVKTTYEGLAHIFETLVFIFLGIGFFAFSHTHEDFNPFLIFYSIISVIISRFCAITICATLANILNRNLNLTAKRQFFLWFSGIRGAMAFALSIKSMQDYFNGKIILSLTIIIISITLVYGSFFVDIAISKCSLQEINKDNFNSENFNFGETSWFDRFKNKIVEINHNYLHKYTLREVINETNRHIQLNEIKKENINSINIIVQNNTNISKDKNSLEDNSQSRS